MENGKSLIRAQTFGVESYLKALNILKARKKDLHGKREGEFCNYSSKHECFGFGVGNVFTQNTRNPARRKNLVHMN